jgi:hypothetical protein
VAFTLAWLLMGSVAAAETGVLPKPDLSARNSDTERLRGGWHPWGPYQDCDYRGGAPRVEERPLSFSTDAQFMLSPATQTPQMVTRLNGTIDGLQLSGEFRSALSPC